MIALPPADERVEIVSRVKSLIRAIDFVEQRVRKTQQSLETAATAVLTKAFVSELVPTEAALARLEGREYESAEQLLARIARERQAYITSTKGANHKSLV